MIVTATKRFLRYVAALLLAAAASLAHAGVVEIRPAVVDRGGAVGIEYRSGGRLVGHSTDAAPAGVELLVPGAKPVPVRFQTKTEREGVIELGPVKIGALRLRWRIAEKNASLVERTLEVTADSAQQFAVTFPLDLATDGEYASFSGPAAARTFYDTVRGSAKRILSANLLGFLGVVIAAPMLATVTLIARYAMRKMLDLDPWPEPEVRTPLPPPGLRLLVQARKLWREIRPPRPPRS